MIKAVVFDVGGTMHVSEKDAMLQASFSQQALWILKEGGIRLDVKPEDFFTCLSRQAEEYKAWSEISKRELPAVQIWRDYYLKPYNIDIKRLEPLAENLSYLYDYSRVRLRLRPCLKEIMVKLHGSGLTLGVISNIISRTFVPRILQEYEIMKYMSCVVLSSVTGIRKPDPGIFRIAESELKMKPDELAYVGDTVSRDVIGTKNAGWRLMIQIKNPSIAFRDSKVINSGYLPDYSIQSLDEIPAIIARENEKT